MKQTIYAVLAAAVLTGCASGPKLPPPDFDAPLTQLDAVGYVLVDRIFGGEQFCAATLVAPDEVVTAAHCLIRGGKIAGPDKISFQARNRNLNSKVVGILIAPPAHQMNFFGLGGKEGWVGIGQDYAKLRIETPLGDTLGIIPAVKPDIQAISEGGEFSVAGVPEGKFKIQHGCRLHQQLAQLEDKDAKNYLKASASAKIWEFSVTQFGIGKNGPTSQKRLENGVFTHTCPMRPGYSGGPLLKRMSGTWALAGVNTSGIAKNKKFSAHMIAEARSLGIENVLNSGLGVSRLAYICREGRKCQESFW